MVGDFSLLGCSAPARLPQILAVDFAPHLGRELAVEATIMAAVEVEALVPLISPRPVIRARSRRYGMARSFGRLHVRQ
jgi:hypothetical protein